MRLTVADVKADGSVCREEDFDPARLLGPLPQFIHVGAPVRAAVEASLTRGEILVTGRVQARLQMTCVRCLSVFERTWDGGFQQAVSPDLKEFEVDGDIREAVLLDLPANPLCDAACRGLCPVCGVNRNTTPCACKGEPPHPRCTALDDLRLE